MNLKHFFDRDSRLLVNTAIGSSVRQLYVNPSIYQTESILKFLQSTCRTYAKGQVIHEIDLLICFWLTALMSTDSTLPCFMVYGEQTANQLRDRFQPTLTHAFIGDHINKLIDSSLGSHWTRLYDSVRSMSFWMQNYSNVEQYQYYSQSIL